MKKYKINVNNKVYEVLVEEVTETSEVISKAATQAKRSTSSSNVVKSPLQGKITKVLVTNGQQVKQGDVVCLIEAMKMENEVQSSVDGVVSEVLVSVGEMVENNQDLIGIK